MWKKLGESQVLTISTKYMIWKIPILTNIFQTRWNYYLSLSWFSFLEGTHGCGRIREPLIADQIGERFIFLIMIWNPDSKTFYSDPYVNIQTVYYFTVAPLLYTYSLTFYNTPDNTSCCRLRSRDSDCQGLRSQVGLDVLTRPGWKGFPSRAEFWNFDSLYFGIFSWKSSGIWDIYTESGEETEVFSAEVLSQDINVRTQMLFLQIVK